MSYRLVHSALYTGGLQTTQKIVLMALADFANDATGECWPAQETLANLCGMSRKTCNQAIKALTEKGIVTGAGWHGKTPLYRLNLSPTVTPVTESYTKAHVTESNTYLLPTVTPPVTQGYTKVLPTVTQTDNINREDNKESNKQASNSILSNNIENPPKEPTPKTEKPTTKTETPKMNPQVIQTPTAQAKPLPACPAAAANVAFTLKEIALAALAKLKAEGIDEQKAKAKLKAVAEEFKRDATVLKENGYPSIANPKAYLTAKLYGMAKKGPKQQAPRAEEPTRLEDIFNLLKKEWATQYPEVAEHIKCLTLADFWQNTIDALRADEVAGWPSKGGVTSVRNRLKGFVFAKVQAWRQDELKATGEYKDRLERRLAQLRSSPNSYYVPPNGPNLEDHLKELESNLARAKENYKMLLWFTTRPTAA